MGCCTGTKLQFICRWEGTVIRNIWPHILFISIYTTVIVALHKYVQHGFEINFPQTLIPVLGFVTGLLLVFRTNTAYDRYWEGRKLWSSITNNIRTLTRYVWAVVEEKNTDDVVEKLSIINLLVAFPFAVKNYLRADYSYEAEDLKGLITHLPRFVPHARIGCSSLLRAKLAKENGNDAVLVGVNVISDSTQNLRASKRDKWRAHAEPTETNIPTEILLYFASYLSKLATQERPVSPPFIITMNAALSSLSDSVSGLERILQTPIPLAYAVHLEHVVWIYLLALPYQIVESLNWWTIPAVTLASFCLLGILDIGGEIENPFGTDYNDLPLEEICERIKREAYITVGRKLTAPSVWIMSTANHPVFPTNSTNAVDLSQKTMEEVHDLLAKRAENFSRANYSQ